MRKSFVIVGALVTVLAALAAGCGGGGGGDELTRDEYVQRLDQICADFNAKQEEIGEPQNLEEVGELGPRIVEEFDKAVDEARGLNPPSEIEEQVNRFLDLADQQSDLLRDLIEAAQDGDNARVQQIGTQLGPLDEQSDQIARDLGAEECAAD